MTRDQAALIARQELNKYSLTDWGVRINPNLTDRGLLGLCSYKDKCIILNGHMCEIHPDSEILNTIRHEVAHALTPGHQHDIVWASKAREIGCTSIGPCSHLSLPADVINAIRLGAEIEFTLEKKEVINYISEITEVEVPKYKVTRLQERCDTCHKVAVTKRESIFKSKEDDKPDRKIRFLECGHVIVSLIPKGTPFHKILADGDPNCNHEWNKTKCMKCGGLKPYDFQLEGMRFAEAALASQRGALIMDEMGLGKTIQALGVIKYHPEYTPTLFIVKSGLKFQWFKEQLRWIDNSFVCQIISSSKDFLILNLKGYIIGYDMLVPKNRMVKGKTVSSGFPISKFVERGIKLIVMDECQQIKNPDSTRTQIVRRLVKETNAKVLPLSGTPWKNRFSEAYSALNLCDPYKFGNFQAFKDNHVSYYIQGDYVKEGGCKDPKAFKELTRDILIRRQRTEVLSELPLVNRMKLHAQLDEFNQSEYDESTSEFVKWYNEKVINGEEDELSGMNILAKLSRMRHITGLAKIPVTKEFIDQFFEETDRKLVVFVHHQDVGQILYHDMKAKYSSEFPVLELTSSMNSQKRFGTQELFNKSPRALMIASTLAAGEGLNLQTCADCVLHERQWNPANEEQAEGRFIRIGQTATSVNATYTEAEDTIDTFFDGIVERKRLYFHEAHNKGEAPKWNDGDLAKELAESIVNAYRKKNARSNKVVKISDRVKHA